MLASACLQMHYRAKFGWYDDEWDFVLYRSGSGLDHVLEPHNEHIVVLMVVIYKLFFTLFGFGNVLPIQLFSVAMYLLSVVMLFLWMRSLVGDATSLVGCALILFLGFSFDNMLSTFQMFFTIPMAAGLAALLMLRKDTRKGDLLACVLLVISTLAGSLGLIFVAGALVALLTRDHRSIRRSYVVLVPVVIYFAWWIGWGSDVESSASLSNLADAPAYVLNSIKSSASVLTGTYKLTGDPGIWITRAIGLALVAVLGFRLKKIGRVPTQMLIAVVLGLTFWTISAINENELRNVGVNRYEFQGAIFLLMILAGAFEGTRPPPRYVAAMAAVAVVPIVANVSALGPGYRDVIVPHYESEMAVATATEIGRPAITPGTPIFINGYYATLAKDYFEVVDRFGYAGWGEEEALDRSNIARTAIDTQFIRSLPVVLRKTGEPMPRRDCRLEPASSTPGSVELDGTRYFLRPTSDVQVVMGRFGDGAGVPVGEAAAGRTTELAVPSDGSDLPWRIGFAGTGAVRVCPDPRQS